MSAVATLKALLGMDTAQYKAAMRDATSTTSEFQRGLSRVGGMIAGAFSVGAIAAFSKRVIDHFSEIRHAADNIGTSAETFQALQYTAKGYGLEVENVARMFAQLESRQKDAAEGQKQAADAFASLGISMAEVISLTPEQMLERVARAARDAGMPVGVLGDLIGERLGYQAVGFLQELADKGMGGVEDAARNAGAVLREDLVSELERAGTAMDQLKLRGLAFAATFFNRIREGLDATSDFWGAVIAGKGFTGANEAVKQGYVRRQKEADDAEWAVLEHQARQQRLQEEDRTRRYNKKWQEDDVKRKEKADRVSEAEQKRIEAARERKQDRMQSLADQAWAVFDRYEQRAAALQGKGLAADSLMQIGGLVGGDRANVGYYDRQLRLTELQKEYTKEIRDIQQKILRLWEVGDGVVKTIDAAGAIQ